MLIDKNKIHAPNDVVSIRTLAGEEIIGRFVEAGAHGITLSRPMVLGSRMTGESSIEVGFLPMPLMNSAAEDASLTFPLTGLSIAAVRTKPEVASGYLQYTTSLALPTGSQASAILRP